MNVLGRLTFDSRTRIDVYQQVNSADQSFDRNCGELVIFQLPNFKTELMPLVLPRKEIMKKNYMVI